MVRPTRQRFAASALAAGLVLAGLPLPAEACGGFFCRTQPVDQAGEKILFVTDGDHVDATIQIQFTGQAKDFSWVVPLARKPLAYGVSSDEVFSLLGRNTMPRYQLDWKQAEGNCPLMMEDRAQPVFAIAPNTAAGESGSAVTIVEKGIVGNYDFTLLSSTDAGELEQWLKDNGYNVPADFDDKARTYIDGKFVFLALKLLEGKTTGDLQPIRLKLDEQNPCVPIRLTAIAAQPDMPIILYAFGPGRAIPRNYRHVRLNETLLDWVGASPNFGGSFPGGTPSLPTPNYNDVVNKSMNEAGGRGFVTELATGSAGLVTLLANRASQYSPAGIASAKSARAAIEAVRDQGYPVGIALQGIIDRHLNPQAASEAWTLLNNGRGFFGPVPFPGPDASNVAPDPDPGLDLAVLDAASFSADIDAMFAKPMREAADLAGRAPWVTRLYTTMSADEMTEDPVFGFNPRLPQVNNLRRAEATPVCQDMNYSIRIKLEDGTVFTTRSGSLPPIAEIPAAAVIEMLDEDAATPTLVSDRGPVIRAALADWQAGKTIGTTPALPLGPTTPGGTPGGAGNTASGGGGGQGATVSGASPALAAVPGCACSNPVRTAMDTRAADREGAFWGLSFGIVAAMRLRRRRRQR
ncbi:MAG: DUF2330 domain-containing protein [Candidatus Sericytochromatia bacterium]|nr:DUF2330 domain-containing protein [Candidatus Tanganyikabacteria bacterium]